MSLSKPAKPLGFGNDRPRQTLGSMKPSEALAKVVTLID
jgi:hypothetical protein